VRFVPTCAAAHVAQDDELSQVVLQPSLDADVNVKVAITTCSNAAPYTDHELEDLMQKLFVLQDLDKNGMLEERELVLLNRKIAIAHYGEGVDEEELKAKYQELFRTRLAQGDKLRAVPYARFRCYMFDVLQELDTDRHAQKLIVEQFIAEASLGRALFHAPGLRSDSDLSLLSKITKPTDEKWLPTVLLGDKQSEILKSSHSRDAAPL